MNIATGKKLTINRLYEIIANSLDSDLKPTYVDKRKGDITHSIANIDKMSKINFKSDYSNFEKQINKTIQWFKEN